MPEAALRFAPGNSIPNLQRFLLHSVNQRGLRAGGFCPGLALGRGVRTYRQHGKGVQSFRVNCKLGAGI